MGILVNKPVQWKVTSFLVGSSDENSADFFLSSQALYWPGNISNDASFGHQHQEHAGRAFWSNVGHVGFEDMKENFCQVVLSQRFWFLPHFGGTFHRFPNLTDIFKRLESWNQRISRPANGGCSNGASGRDKCVKLFVCCEATNAALNQRLEEAGGGELQYSWHPF